MRKVSIIIPAYNADAYIQKGINSLINQTYKNIEIIVINDGSSDKTKYIVENIKDKRIILINNENHGIGYSRNLGIKKSTGDYIMFMDSDDYFDDNYVELMEDYIEKNNCDLVVSNYIIDSKKNIPITLEKENRVLEGSSKDKFILKINPAPWNKIYKRDLVLNKSFPTNLKYEDVPFVIECMLDAPKIGFLNKYPYHYVMHANNETTSRNDERLFDIFQICDILKKIYEKYNYPYFCDSFVKIFIYYIKNAKYIKSRKIRRKFLKSIYKYLNEVDKNWRKCEYLNDLNYFKKLILVNEFLANVYANFS